MEWNELTVTTATEAVEAVCNILLNAGAAGTVIEDELDFINLKDDGFGTLKEDRELPDEGHPVYVKAYFPDSEHFAETVFYVRSQLEKLTDLPIDTGLNELSVHSVREEDWENSWKQYYHPIRVTRFLTIVPYWENYRPADDKELLITLDPGMAFGTGTHPTTRLSLAAMEEVLRGGEKVMDVGTGSGVLSIAAKALGAGTVLAYDIDEVATKVTRENIGYNAYAADISVQENNLLEGIEGAEADIIVANILAEILAKMVPDAWNNLKSGGQFILSGIIEPKKDELIRQLEQQGFNIEQTKQMKDWVCLICRKGETG